MRKYINSFAVGSAIMLTGCGASNTEQRLPDDSTATQVRFPKAKINASNTSEETSLSKSPAQTPTIRIAPPTRDPAENVTPEAIKIYARLCVAAIEGERIFNDELGEETEQSCYEILVRRNRLHVILERCYRLNIPGLEFKVTDPVTKLKIESVRILLVPLMEEINKLNSNPCLRSNPKKKEERI